MTVIREALQANVSERHVPGALPPGYCKGSPSGKNDKYFRLCLSFVQARKYD